MAPLVSCVSSCNCYPRATRATPSDWARPANCTIELNKQARLKASAPTCRRQAAGRAGGRRALRTVSRGPHRDPLGALVPSLYLTLETRLARPRAPFLAHAMRWAPGPPHVAFQAPSGPFRAWPCRAAAVRVHWHTKAGRRRARRDQRSRAPINRAGTQMARPLPGRHRLFI